MWIYILLGVLQGVFEWVPISSEGIVALASQFFLIGSNPVDIALFLHTGTLFAVLIYFRKDWRDAVKRKDPQFLNFLIIATVVSLVIGFPLYTLVREVAVGTTLLIVMGFGLLLTSYFHSSKKTFGIDMNKLALIAGFLQGLAVIPGLSRSGSTIFGLSLGKLKPSEILRYSYMMSAPVVLVSTAYLVLSNPVLIEGWPSIISSFLVGLLSLHFLMRISQRINFQWFALIFAILCFVGAAVGFYV